MGVDPFHLLSNNWWEPVVITLFSLLPVLLQYDFPIWEDTTSTRHITWLSTLFVSLLFILWQHLHLVGVLLVDIKLAYWLPAHYSLVQPCCLTGYMLIGLYMNWCLIHLCSTCPSQAYWWTCLPINTTTQCQHITYQLTFHTGLHYLLTGWHSIPVSNTYSPVNPNLYTEEHTGWHPMPVEINDNTLPTRRSKTWKTCSKT